jgi:threonyl-tRNA synthetase
MRMAQGKKAMLPVWLSPTQVRVIPVGDKHKEHGMKVLARLRAHQVRADIDDRDEPLGKKIRDAQKEWVPFIAVMGDREAETGVLTVNVRQPEGKQEMSVDALISIVEKENSGKPFERLSLPAELSKRPVI